MQISIFGLGYVGTVSGACLARDGHEVVGVDPARTKVDLINRGQSPIVEKGIDVLVEEGVEKGRLRATDDAAEAVASTELSMICVGTPSQDNGSLDLGYIEHVCTEIGTALADKDSFHVVVVRSTVLPGTLESTVIPALEAASGKRAGIDFGICNNPEFLREGTAVEDFYNPPKTVIGASDKTSADLLKALYRKLDAPLFVTDIRSAEMVKYADNVWHALKICFANEIGNIAKAAGVDSHKVMDIFCADTKLNISPAYLKPGFAFGGSCLPKDVRALGYRARSADVPVPVIDAILPSNRLQVDRAVRMITDRGSRRVGVLGFSFKGGTDDLRESPMVEVIERLIGKGYDLKIYDRNVNLARLIGANREFLLRHIPHIASLMVESMEEALAHGEVIVVGNRSPEFDAVPGRLRARQHLVDLVRLAMPTVGGATSEGICW